MALFGKLGLTLILLGYFVASSVTTYLLLRSGYAQDKDERWVLIGGLRSDSATFRVRRDSPLTPDSFVVATDEALTNEVFRQALLSTDDSDVDSPLGTNSGRDASSMVASFVVGGLESNTKYHYARLAGDGEILRRGSFRTAPEEGVRTNFSFATAGCAWSGSNADVFTRIRDEHDPLFFLHLGDLHYEGLDVDDVGKRIQAIDQVMDSTQRDLFANTPLSVMWDDHDYVGNDSDGNSPGKEAALDSYRLIFPYNPINETAIEPQPAYHAFTIGTVRFVITDLRSEATKESIFSEKQREWFFDELSNAENYDFVIWVTTKPWIREADPSEIDDDWSGHPQDRQDISDHIRDVVPNNLIAIAADAHMLAFDDGSNTYYGSASEAEISSVKSFPLLHSGPLDRLGSFKGGPYSDGCYAFRWERNHQFSIVKFVTNEANEDGDQESACLEITAYSTGRWFSSDTRSSKVFTRRLCGDIFSVNDRSGSCSKRLFSPTNLAILIFSILFLVSSMLTACWLGEGTSNQVIVTTLLVVSYVFSLGIGVLIPYIRGVDQFDTFEVSLIVTLQMATAFIYLVGWTCCGRGNRAPKYN